MNDQKGLAPIAIILIIVGVLAAAGGVWYGSTQLTINWQKTKVPAQKACTQEAKICPDGTSVGRTGPNCEFAACPTENKNKIYSVDELIKSNLEEETEVLVKGRYGIELISAGPDYEGPGGGSYLFGQTEKLQISFNGLPNTETNQIITVKGKVKYCGGKKTPKYICALTESELVPETVNGSTTLTNKIYSVDELIKSNLEEETEVLVQGRLNIELISAGADYEGPGGGYYLFGETSTSVHLVGEASIHLKPQKALDGVELNKIITVKGKVKYCGGKKIAKYICGLTDVSVVDKTASWKTYRNEKYRFEIQYPKIWIKKDPIPKFDTFIIQIASNERFGNPPSLVYKIWIAKHGALPMLDGIKMDYTEEKIGDLTTYKTTKIPAADGILSYFFKKSNGEYIEISMSPYGTKFPEQTKYVGIFDQILSTFKFIK